MPASYVVHQGTCIQREGRIHIRQDASGQVWVGGDSVTCITRQRHPGTRRDSP